MSCCFMPKQIRDEWWNYIFSVASGDFLKITFSKALFGSSLFLTLGKYDDPVGEGSGTPLQYSCLENPMDGEAR